MSATDTAPAPLALPRPNAETLVSVLIAGAFATIAFDLFGQFLSPILKSIASPYLGAKLAPVGLANGVIHKLTGLPAGQLGLGHALHVLAGLIAYPVGFLMLQAVSRRVVPAMPWWLLAVGYGVALWVFALYGMAHLVAGNPPFLVRSLDDGGWAFQSITWVALWGHIVFAVVAAAVLRWRGL
ncbi:MAG: hypothetical protein AAF074_02465 [Pseudomonadota bacterium]